MNPRETAPPSAPAGSIASARALEEAFARHQGELLGTLFYVVGNVEDARDALQESFLKCWQHLSQVPQVENLKAWIFRIALNTGRDLRSSAWKRRRQPLADDGAHMESAVCEPHALLVKSERIELLRSALSQLRPEEQEVFLLRQNGELTYEEIASAIDLPVGTVKTRMRLALTKLRTALERKEMNPSRVITPSPAGRGSE